MIPHRIFSCKFGAAFGSQFQGSVQKHVDEDAFWKRFWQYRSNIMDTCMDERKCLLVDVHLVDSLLLISRKNLELDTRPILQEMYQKRLSLCMYVFILIFFKFVFGCLQLNFKQPIGVTKNRFLDSSRHLTRQVLSSIYVLHLKFLYGYRKKLPVISEGVPFSTPPWCKI